MNRSSGGARLPTALLGALLLGTAPYVFTVTNVDVVPDLHGNPANAQLVIFAAGNQYMVMPALIAAFERAHPSVTRVFYETLPPGILAKQIAAGALQVGNLTIDPRPDLYLSGKKRMAIERARGVVGPPRTYATNTLAILVHAGNPKHVERLSDLGRTDVKVAMPNPAWEGVAAQIEAAYRKAGGAALESTIMKTKLAAGSTLLTKIHHRQTPRWILSGRADAGVVWISEALYQAKLTGKLAVVRIPTEENTRAIYQAAVITDAPHRRAAQDFVDFLTGTQARNIYASYGFTTRRIPQ
ncbi:MAG TPA: substrate-binding domain-containing protein [Candidatus Dormibacteraeota bacterium]|nr:substrate-binding domain-containing protein [Candidatus Dormibacteraeota bacterium]